MMASMSLQALAPLVSGQCFGEAEFDSVSTDSRRISPGDLFVALSGEHFDGSDYMPDAFAAGAVGAITARYRKDCVQPQLLVSNTQKALGVLGRENRRRFSGPVVAITGSSGKTSCKQLLASILGEAGNTLATEGNENNEIGVPRTLLKISPGHEFAVIEMGARNKGDIGYLCALAEPDIAMVSNVMPAHIERFGSLEVIARTKGEIYSALPEDGVAVINADDSYAALWREMAGHCRQYSFSLQDPAADFFAADLHFDLFRGMAFTLCCNGGRYPVSLPLPGRHAVANALAAAACAVGAGISIDHIQAGLSKVRPVSGRMHLLPQAAFSLIDDTYNANPGSVRAAIDVLAETRQPATLILGVMAELGDHAAEMHRQIGAYAASRGVEQVLAVGEFAEEVVAGFGGHGVAFENIDQFQRHCLPDSLSGVVLVKGSRSAGMERVVAWLTNNSKKAGVN